MTNKAEAKVEQFNVRVPIKDRELVRRVSARLRADPNFAAALAGWMDAETPAATPGVLFTDEMLDHVIEVLQHGVINEIHHERNAALFAIRQAVEHGALALLGSANLTKPAASVKPMVPTETLGTETAGACMEPLEVVRVLAQLLADSAVPPAPGRTVEKRKPPTKVTPEMESRIKELRRAGMTRDRIARTVGVSGSVVTRVIQTL
jgi:hypothetical protein